MSLRAYADHRGVSPEAVSRAIKAGRLRRSVVYVDDRPKITSPEAADVEWAESTDNYTRGSEKDRRITSRLRQIAIDAAAPIDPFEVLLWKDGETPIWLSHPGDGDPEGAGFIAELTPAMARRIGAHLIVSAARCDRRGR